MFDKDFYDSHGFVHLGKTMTDENLIRMRKECMKSWNGLKDKYDPRFSSCNHKNSEIAKEVTNLYNKYNIIHDEYVNYLQEKTNWLH